MTYAELKRYCLGKPGAWEDQPWEGDIVAKNMVMEDGVYFRGNCQIGTK